MTRMILMAAALTLGAGMAHADTLSDQIQSDLESQGYKDIEISQEDSRINVEAVRGNQTVEFVYDAETGDLISDDEERTTGLERAEQVSGKELPANGDPDRDDDGDDDSEGGRGNGNAGNSGNANAGDNGKGNGAKD